MPRTNVLRLEAERCCHPPSERRCSVIAGGQSESTTQVTRPSSRSLTSMSPPLTPMVLRSLVCCGPANNTIPVDQAFDRSVRAPLSESLREGLEQLGARHHANQLTFGQAIREAM